MTKRTKIIIVAAIAAILAYGGYIFAKPYYDIWKMAEGWEDFKETVEDYLKNDKYGGATPEETYNLYLAALKSSDLESASKYFYWQKQVEQKARLEEMKAKGELEKYIANLPEWGKLKEKETGIDSSKEFILTEVSSKPITVKVPDGRGGVIEGTSPPGEYAVFDINFELNAKANIWKIYSL